MSQPHQPLSFLSLPVEIRLQIYQHLITTFSWGSALHINLTSQFNPLYRPCPGSGQLTYLPCLVPNQLPVPSPMSGVTNTMDLFRYHTHYETCRGWHIKNGTAPALQGTYLSIFLTCRTMYFPLPSHSPTDPTNKNPAIQKASTCSTNPTHSPCSPSQPSTNS